MKLTPAQKKHITKLLVDLSKDPFNEEAAKKILQLFEDENFASSGLYKCVAARINKLQSNFLHWLVFWNKKELVRKLINAGVEFNIKEGTGDHPLHVAAKYNRLSIVKLLLDEDVEYARDNGDELPPETAVKNKTGQLPIELCKSIDIKNLFKRHGHFYNAASAEYSSSEDDSPSPIIYNRRLETPITDDPVANPLYWDTKDAICFPLPTKFTAPVGQIQWKNLTNTTLKQNVSARRWGSGFMIDATTFVTAGHCFDALPYGNPSGWHCVDNKNFQAVPSKDLPKLMTVNFNYQLSSCGSPKNDAADYEVRYNIVSLAEHRYGNLDYAIIKLDPKPYFVGTKATKTTLASNGVLKLSADIPAVGSKLTIVQHPDGLPKKLQAGQLASIDTDRKKLHYSVSTDGGSSGSPVLDANSQVVAVHTNGFDQKGERLNSGVTIAAIRQVSPIIKGYFPFFSNVKPISAASATAAAGTSAPQPYPTRFSNRFG